MPSNLALAYGVFLDTCYAICFSEYVDGEGDDEDDIVSKLYGNAQRELMMERYVFDSDIA